MIIKSTNNSIFRTSCRFFCSSVSHHNYHQKNHKFLQPNSLIGSWEAPKNPKEAASKLALLRRQYAKQVKELRKEYIKEMDLIHLEKQRKEEARKEALRIAKEERKKLKAEAAKVRAEKRVSFEEELRQILLKERAERLENWRKKEIMREESKKQKNELLCRQSSLWISENELEEKILEGIRNTSSL